MYWWQYPINGPHNPPTERGIDLAMPVGTPIYSPFAGTVLGRSDYTYATDTSSVWGTNQVQGAYAQTGYNQWGGEVDILTQLAGIGQKVGYVFHLDALAVKPGQQVAKGQLIGYSGGENTLSTTNVVPGYTPTHIATTQWSSGPHIELGAYSPTNWASVIDPTSIVNNLRATGMSTSGVDPTSLPTGTTTGLSLNPADWANAFTTSIKTGFTDVALRAGLVTMGIVLIFLGILILFFAHGGGEDIESGVSSVAPLAAA